MKSKFDLKFDRILSERIKDEMKSSDFTQHELAEILDIPYRTLNTWLNGQRKISAEYFYYMSKVVGFSMDEITKSITKEMN